MVSVEITQELLHELFYYEHDTGNLIRKKSGSGKGNNIGAIAGSHDAYGYIRITIKGNLYKAHRLIWMHVYGKYPENFIDHINGIQDDNRLCNLREATNTENQRNRKTPKNNTSGYKGVFWNTNDNKWWATITVDGKRLYLGAYDIAEDASIVYEKFAKDNFKEFYNEKI